MLTTSSRIPAWTADWPSYCSLLRRPTVDTAESSAVGSGRCPMARSPREVHEGASRVDGRWMELAMLVAYLSSQWVRRRFRLSGPCAVSSRREGNTPRFFCLQIWELSGSYRRPVRGCTWLYVGSPRGSVGVRTYGVQPARYEHHPASFAQVTGQMEVQGGAVCKTVGSAYVGANPTPATTCENGPLAAETRPGGPFPSCPAVCHRVPP